MLTVTLNLVGLLIILQFIWPALITDDAGRHQVSQGRGYGSAAVLKKYLYKVISTRYQVEACPAGPLSLDLVLEYEYKYHVTTETIRNRSKLVGNYIHFEVHSRT